MSKLTPIILIVFSAILFFAFINPQYRGDANKPGIKELQEQKDRYDEVLEKARELLSKRDSLQKQYDSIPQDDLNRISSMLPDNLDNVKLVLDLDRMASTYGISIKNINVSDNKQKNANDDKKVTLADNSLYGVATISFSVTAPYDVFLRFMRDLEDGLRLIDITNLSINPKDPKAYDYSVTFKTYWLK